MRRSFFLSVSLIAFLLSMTTASLGIANAHGNIAHASTTHIVKMVNTEGGSYAFSPKTITIKVGQTVTWKNVSNTQHTATANNFSFDTGPIKSHHQASHKFKKAGTFKYICSFHAFMKGVVKVVK